VCKRSQGCGRRFGGVGKQAYAIAQT
jgi:hypothetical protein